MDITETYIKMCEKAEEIQKEWRPDLGDYCSHPSPFNNVQNPEVICEGGPWITYGFFWLPRQDQLQEMMVDKVGGQRVSLHWWFNDFVSASPRPLEYTLNVTLEQLWLAFVMKEKFNKIWDREDWVREDVR